MNDLPILITYIKTGDGGQELKYSLRSLTNILNFNNSVTIVGEKETWFKNLNFIAVARKYGYPYTDQHIKIKQALEYMPETFIIGQDDVYVTEPTIINSYYIGALPTDARTPHQRTKVITRDKLLSLGAGTLDYESHTLMKVDRDKLSETLDIIQADKNRSHLQFRSIYGNLNKIGGEYYEDKKTRTKELPKGKFISTNFYIDELDKLFPEKSRYEI